MIQIFHNNKVLDHLESKSVKEAKRLIEERYGSGSSRKKWTKHRHMIDGLWYECHFGGPSDAFEIRELECLNVKGLDQYDGLFTGPRAEKKNR